MLDASGFAIDVLASDVHRQIPSITEGPIQFKLYPSGILKGFGDLITMHPILETIWDTFVQHAWWGVHLTTHWSVPKPDEIYNLKYQ